jgi:hypothetical protein
MWIVNKMENPIHAMFARRPANRSLFSSSYANTMAPTKTSRKQASTSVMKPKKKISAASVVGAPAQHNQSSRKGKKAWRKNVDIEDLVEKLEGLREEERTLG